MRALTAAEQRPWRRVIGIVACLAGVALLASACGTAEAPGRQATPTGLALARTHHVPSADSRAGATAYARRLLAGLRLPPGARKLPWPAKPPAGLDPMNPEILSDTVDLKVLYRVSASTDAVSSFLATHPPNALMVSTNGSYSHFGNVTSEFVGFAPRTLPAGIYSAELNTTFKPRPGGGSLLRADAFVAWYPPRGSARLIDPAGYRAVTIRWQHGYSVTVRTFTSRTAVAHFAGMYNALYGAPDVVTSCPAELAGPGRSDYQIVFSPVPGQPRVVVSPTNCMFVEVSIGGRSVSSLYPAADLLTAAQRAVHRT